MSDLAELLDRLAALDDLMDEARGDHSELAKVRRTIAEQIDPGARRVPRPRTRTLMGE